MKSLLSIFFFFTTFLLKAQTIESEQAKNYIGKDTNVCGTVSGTHATDKVTFINMGGKFPNNAFTVVVFNSNTIKFSYKLSSLEGKYICVEGVIRDYKGKPEIIAEAEKQITIKMQLTPPSSQRE